MQSGSGRRRKGRILLVDDSRATRKALQLMLDADEYDSVEASNGQDALRVLETDEIDLVITDLYMPEVDGFGLLGRMRDLAAHTVMPPVLVLTTESHSDVIADIKAAGATGVLQKPVDRHGLRIALKHYLG